MLARRATGRRSRTLRARLSTSRTRSSVSVVRRGRSRSSRRWTARFCARSAQRGDATRFAQQYLSADEGAPDTRLESAVHARRRRCDAHRLVPRSFSRQPAMTQPIVFLPVVRVSEPASRRCCRSGARRSPTRCSIAEQLRQSEETYPLDSCSVRCLLARADHETVPPEKLFRELLLLFVVLGHDAGARPGARAAHGVRTSSSAEASSPSRSPATTATCCSTTCGWRAGARDRAGGNIAAVAWVKGIPTDVGVLRRRARRRGSPKRAGARRLPRQQRAGHVARPATASSRFPRAA